jgi:hypothetical protein
MKFAEDFSAWVLKNLTFMETTWLLITGLGLFQEVPEMRYQNILWRPHSPRLSDKLIQNEMS